MKKIGIAVLLRAPPAPLAYPTVFAFLLAMLGFFALTRIWKERPAPDAP